MHAKSDIVFNVLLVSTLFILSIVPLPPPYSYRARINEIHTKVFYYFQDTFRKHFVYIIYSPHLIVCETHIDKVHAKSFTIFNVIYATFCLPYLFSSAHFCTCKSFIILKSFPTWVKFPPVEKKTLLFCSWLIHYKTSPWGPP